MNMILIKPSRMRWTGHVARVEDKRNAYRTFVGKPEAKRPLENRDVGGRILQSWDGMGWIHLTEYKPEMASCENFWGPKNVGEFLSS
jgi:hypothetical protein